MGWLDGKKIVDAVYGDSYTPLIQKIYKNDELIFERSMWDYELYDYVDDTKDGGSISTSHASSVQPEVDILPFSEENINRNWEFLINAYTENTREQWTTIGIIGQKNDGVGNSYYVQLGIRPSGLYMFHRGYITGTHDQVFPCDPINKDVRVVKDNSTDIKFYVEDELINTFILSKTDPSTKNKVESAWWYGGRGDNIFGGRINYFKFRFTS